jgi:penicillin-binding protein 2A
LTDANWDQNVAFSVPEGVKDLGSPIRIENIDNVEAKYTFKPMGLITLTLEWDAQEDDRVEYRIYEQSDKEQKLVGTVTGKGYFEIPYVNIFSNNVYKVAPYNVQTKQEGVATEFIKPRFFSAN